MLEMASGRKKTIDEIENILEMVQAMKALGISCEGLKTLEEMKARVKAKADKTPDWTSGQVRISIAMYIER